MEPQETELPLNAPQMPRVRPAVPPGAQAADAATTELPMPAPTQADELTLAPVGAIHPWAGERRRSPRQTLVAKAVVRSELDQGAFATGFLSNISMLGVGFHTRRPLSVGEKFEMSLEVGPMKWATRLRVVCCQPHDSGTYDVGAEFIGSELPDSPQRDLAA